MKGQERLMRGQDFQAATRSVMSLELRGRIRDSKAALLQKVTDVHNHMRHALAAGAGFEILLILARDRRGVIPRAGDARVKR